MEKTMNPSTHTLPPKQAVTIKDKAGYWQQHMDAWQASDLTQPVYCQQQGISLAAFGYWRTRLKKNGVSNNTNPINFLPVRLQSTRQTSLTL